MIKEIFQKSDHYTIWNFVIWNFIDIRTYKEKHKITSFVILV